MNQSEFRGCDGRYAQTPYKSRSELLKDNKRLKRQLESCISTLRVIQTWATFEGGVELVPKHVDELIDETLENSRGYRQKKST